MANELAAMATLPNGATISVLTTWAQGVAHIEPYPGEGGGVLAQGEDAVAPRGNPHHGERDDGKGAEGTHGGTAHAEFEDVDEEVVEHHIQYAHRDAQQTGDVHIARALEHG